MSTETDAARKQVSREVHQALDSLLLYLEYDEVVGLLGSLRKLSDWPHVVSRAFSFASEVVQPDITPRRAGASDKAPATDLPPTSLALAGRGHGELLSAHEAKRRLDAASVALDPEAWAASELLGSKELETLLGVSRSTIHNWRAHGRIIGLRKGLRNHVYPVSQFEGKAPLDGLAEVIAVHSGPEEAWEWLITPNPTTDEEPPLEGLRRGEKDLVLRAADSELDYA